MSGKLPEQQQQEFGDKFNLDLEDSVKLEKDFDQAAHWFIMAAKQGHAEAQARLALLYLTKRVIVPARREEGMKLLRQAYKQHNDLATMLLGIASYQGLEGKPDYNKSFEYFEQVNLSNIDHYLNDYDIMINYILSLGRLYILGQNVKKDNKKALRLYEKVAENGHVGAKKFLAKNYITGKLGKKDPLKSFKITFELELAGDDDAAFINGTNLYLNPEIKKQIPHADIQQVMQDLNEQYVQGDSKAAILLANLILKDSEQRDFLGFAEAMKLFYFAAEEEEFARRQLDSFAKAMLAYEAEAESGSLDAMLFLMILYTNTGPEAHPEYKKAFYFAEKAASYGSPDAVFFLSAFYLKGWGVPKDLDKSWEYMQRAAKMGQKDAVYIVHTCSKPVDLELDTGDIVFMVIKSLVQVGVNSMIGI